VRYGTHFALLLRSHISKLRWRSFVRVMFVTTNPLGSSRPSHAGCRSAPIAPQCRVIHSMALQPAARGTLPVDTRRTSFVFPPKTHCQHAWLRLRIRRQCALETGLPTLADTITSTSPLPSKRTHPPGSWPMQRAPLISCRRRVGIPVLSRFIRPHGPWPQTTTPFFLAFDKQPYLPWGVAFSSLGLRSKRGECLWKWHC